MDISTECKVKSKTLVTIITVCYNSEKTIRDTICSVLNQTYDNIEYLIIDGASNDKTVAIANEYNDEFAKRGFSFKIISEPDNGLYDAMNKGINLANGELVGLINSDDWYENDAIEAIEMLYRETSFDICFGNVKTWNEHEGFVKKPRNRKFKTSRDFCHPGMFVKKDVYIEIGVYNDKFFYADFDFWLRASRKNKYIEILNKVVSNFRLGGVSNQKSIKKAYERFKDRYKVYRNNEYSRIYVIESFLMEFVKLILA